jgi:hypothetical protein
MSGHFQADAALVRELKQRCKELVGHDFVDVRWHPVEECLAIYERHRGEPDNAPGVVRRFLLDDNNEPRQINRADVEEVVGAIYGRREMVDSWRQRWEAKQEEVQRKSRENRREVAYATAKELARVMRSGLRPFVFLGASDSRAATTVASAGMDSGKPYRIVDQYGKEYDD